MLLYESEDVTVFTEKTDAKISEAIIKSHVLFYKIWKFEKLTST